VDIGVVIVMVERGEGKGRERGCMYVYLDDMCMCEFVCVCVYVCVIWLKSEKKRY
jgi:hypothetical protein